MQPGPTVGGGGPSLSLRLLFWPAGSRLRLTEAIEPGRFRSDDGRGFSKSDRSKEWSSGFERVEWTEEG